MVGPAAVSMLGHNQSFVLIRTHWVLTHGITENLGILSYIRIGEIIVTIIFESEWTFGLTTWQSLQAVHTFHFKFTLAKFYFLCWCVVGQLLHVGLKFGATSCTPENVSITIRSLEHAGVDTADAFDGLWLWNEWTLRIVGNSYADTKSKSLSLGGSRWEIEIVLAVSVHTVGCPHRVRVRTYPGHFVLGYNHTMICPIGQIL